jgi:hypothetical protein
MRTQEERRSPAQGTVLAWVEQLLHKKVKWESLPADAKLKFEPYLEERSCKPEVRMRKTMETVAATLKMRWSTDSPSGHPYEVKGFDHRCINRRDRR